MPECLSNEERDVWQTLVPQIPPEALRGIDSYQLEILVKNIIRSRICHQKFKETSELPYSRAAQQADQHIGRIFSQFGGSPVDRSRMKFELPDEADDAEEWMNE